MSKDPKTAADTIINQSISRFQAQLERHSESLKQLESENKEIEKDKKSKRSPRDTARMKEQVDFYKGLIKELESMK